MHTCIHACSNPPPLPAGSGDGMRWKGDRGGVGVGVEVVGAVLSTFYVLIMYDN